jgi:hypothetical protein
MWFYYAKVIFIVTGTLVCVLNQLFLSVTFYREWERLGRFYFEDIVWSVMHLLMAIAVFGCLWSFSPAIPTLILK